MIEKIREKEGNLKNSPKDLKDYLKIINRLLKEVTRKSDDECIGSIKLAHIYHPQMFPLLDNNIIKYFKLQNFKDFGEFLEKYFLFKNAIDKCLDELYIKEINLKNRSIYKLIDEILYLYITQKKQDVVEKILVLANKTICVFLIEKLINCIKEHLKNNF